MYILRYSVATVRCKFGHMCLLFVFFLFFFFFKKVRMGMHTCRTQELHEMQNKDKNHRAHRMPDETAPDRNGLIPEIF